MINIHLIVRLTVWLIIVVTIESNNVEEAQKEIATVVENDGRSLDEETTTMLPMPIDSFTGFMLGQERTTLLPTPLERHTDEYSGEERTTLLPMPLERHTDEYSGEEITTAWPMPIMGPTDDTVSQETTAFFGVGATDYTDDWRGEEGTITWPMPIEDFTDRTWRVDDFTGPATTFQTFAGTREVVHTEETTRPTHTEMPFKVTINSSLTTDSPTFQRPYASDGSFYYDLFEIIPSHAGLYYFQSKSTLDTYGIIYYTEFDDLFPETGIYAFDDEGGGRGQFYIPAYFDSLSTNYLVVTTYYPNSVGDYQLVAKGSHAFTINRITASIVPMPTISISSSLSYFHPQFTRPDHGYSGTPYELYRFTVSASGNYTFRCFSYFGNYVLLYYPSFNPASPSSNLIRFSSSYDTRRLVYDFQSSRQYYVVVSAYFPQTTGNYTLLIKGPEAPNLTKLTNVTMATRSINGILRRYRRYQRPGGVYPSYFYSVYQVIVRRSGYYIFSSNSTADLIGYLYQNNFYAGQPTVNWLSSDDNSTENGQFEFTTYLSSPRTYYFVVTTAERRVTAHFRLSVTGSIIALLQPIQSNILTNATISSEWTTSSNKFRRPYGFGRNHYYQAFEVTVNQKGLYSLICISNVDSVGYVYEDNFDASSPYRNMLTYDDQHGANGVIGGNDQFGVTLILDSGVTYYLVATTYREFRFGSFDIVVQGEGQATINLINAKRR